MQKPMLMAKQQRFELDPELRDACIASIKAGSKSFHAASLLLPPRVRLASRALYAFCRASDDLVDDGVGKNNAQHLQKRVDAIYRGAPHDAVGDLAFAKLISDFEIPRALPDALVEGFKWDDEGRTYQTIDDLLGYATRVASTVGLMMTVIMGARQAHILARAADLGLAMQLTNIARDVGEDARNGRIYLPLDWLKEACIEPQHLLDNPQFTPALGKVVKQLLSVAAHYYLRGLSGLGGLPFDCRPAIRSAAYIYRDIGRQITKAGYNSVDSRAHTSKNRKIELIFYASARPFQITPIMTTTTHESAQFLVDICAIKMPDTPRTMDEKAGRMVELMGISAQRRREARGT